MDIIFVFLREHISQSTAILAVDLLLVGALIFG